MKNFKIFMLITFLLFVSVTLDIIPWIPSLLVENIVNSIIVILYIASAFLVYKFILNMYNQQTEKKIYINTFSAAALLMYIGFFAIFQIGTSLTKSTYVESYSFANEIFYVHNDSNTSYEVSLKENNLPIRSIPIFKHASPISLEMKDNYVYVIGQDLYKNLFDLRIKTTVN